MKLMKRTVAAVLIIATVIGSLCFSVSAADANTPTAKGLEIQKILKGEANAEGLNFSFVDFANQTYGEGSYADSDQTVIYTGDDCYLLQIKGKNIGSKNMGSQVNSYRRAIFCADDGTGVSGFRPCVASDKAGSPAAWNYVLSSTDSNNSRHQMYVNDKYLVNLFYDVSRSFLTVTVEPLPEAKQADYLSVFSEPNYGTGDALCEPLMFQLGTDAEISDTTSGMCYIYRLSDGRFLIYDGGGKTIDGTKSLDTQLAGRIYQILTQYNVLPKVTIAAWTITHTHVDHMGACQAFINSYVLRQQNVLLERFIVNANDYLQTKQVETTDDDLTPTKLLHYHQYLDTLEENDIFVHKAHAGQKYYFADATIEVLYTNDLRGELIKKSDTNALSLITQVTLWRGGPSVIMTGDTTDVPMQITNSLYGTDLDSDFVQAPHHCHNSYPSLNTLYTNADPAYLLFPTSTGGFNSKMGSASNVNTVWYNKGTVTVYPARSFVTRFSFNDTGAIRDVTYLLARLKDFDVIEENGSYELLNDIVISNSESQPAVIEQIAYDQSTNTTILNNSLSGVSFGGVFDGKGHSILFGTGVRASFDVSHGILFEKLSGTVKNLTFGKEGQAISVVAQINGGINIGIVARQVVERGIIESVTAHVDIDVSGCASNANVGLVAKVEDVGGEPSALTVFDSSVFGRIVSNQSTGNHAIGGIVGKLSGGSSLTASGCYGGLSVAATTAGEDRSGVGGILGYCNTTGLVEIHNSVNGGSLDSMAMGTGGIVGVILDAVNVNLTNCLNTSAVIGGSATAGEYGMIVGKLTGSVTLRDCLNTYDHNGDQQTDNEGMVGSAASIGATEINCLDLGGTGVVLPRMTMGMGTGVRIVPTESAALRYRVLVDQALLQTLVEKYGADNVRLGVLWAKAEDVAAAGNIFTKDRVTGAVETTGSVSDLLASREDEWNGAWTGYYAYQTDITSATEKYSCVGFYEITVGGKAYRIYAAYAPSNARSLQDVAKAALADGTYASRYAPSQSALLKNYASGKLS